MSRPTPEEDVQRLGKFKRRADAVLGCSLAREADAPILGRRMQLLVTDEGKLLSLQAALPEKEAVATALTLLRPLTLDREDIFHAKVLGSLSRLNTDSTLAEKLRSTKKAWRDYPSAYLQIWRGKSDGSEPSVSAWNNEVAKAWLYGELVHADDHAALLDALGEPVVLLSAGGMASEGFALVSNTMWLIHQIRPDIQPGPPAYGERHGPGQSATRPATESPTA